MLSGVLFSLNEGLIHFNEREGDDLTCGLNFTVFFFKVKFFFITQPRTKEGLQEM